MLVSLRKARCGGLFCALVKMMALAVDEQGFGLDDEDAQLGCARFVAA